MRPGSAGRQPEEGPYRVCLGYFHDSGNSDAGLLTSTVPGPPLAGITVNSLVPFAAAEAYAIAEPSGDSACRWTIG
jgi:hypothetical protein